MLFDTGEEVGIGKEDRLEFLRSLALKMPKLCSAFATPNLPLSELENRTHREEVEE
jgi:hypothetical protein